jgi:ankyrin repeat protein
VYEVIFILCLFLNLLQLDITPLHLAVDEENVEIIQLLLMNGANINCRQYVSHMLNLPVFIHSSREIFVLFIEHAHMA